MICNHKAPDKELLLKLIQGEVKDINTCGKYGGNGKALEIIELVRPKKFSDLVKISTLMHGINTWKNNGKALFKQGIALDDLLGSRDDIFNTLIKYGIDRDIAYDVMENVRKGKGLIEEQTTLLL